MNGLETLGREALERFRASSGGLEAEVYLSRSEERTLARRDGRLDAVEAGETVGAAVRVLQGGRLGFAAAGGASPEGLDALFARALRQSSLAEPRPGLAFPGPSAGVADPALEASLWDESLFTRSWDEVEALLARAEAACREEKRVARLLRADYGESRGEVVVLNSRGLAARERGASASLSVSASAEAGAETHVGDAFASRRRAAELDPVAVGREAGRRAASLLGAGRAPGGKRPVVFSPRVGAEFLELVSGLLSAEEVQAGRSLLAGRLGGAVASAAVTLRDEPRLRGGPASCAFDDEGMPTSDKAMVEGGVLRALFHDATTAARAGAAPNGCAYRGSYEDTPSAGPSNFVLVPGAAAPAALLAGAKEGLLVHDVLGMHMVDPVSGEFSVGVSGLRFAKGAAGAPFKGAMLSGNLMDLLARVDAVGSDLEFHGAYACPSFRVSSLDVAA
ncbi:MAG: TldD/PmbA family protein [Elusimicrobiota bacterium]|nr:TldD/PmbA family protein [Elusimicrobiota bacterium]